VRAVSLVSKMLAATVALLWGLTVSAQTTVTAHGMAKTSSHAPTRMQRCEAEVKGLTGADRKRLLRECLVSRNEGERVVSRNCFRQFRDRPVSDPKMDKPTFMRQCVVQSLKAGQDKLPPRKVAPAAVASSSAKTTNAAGATTAKAPAATASSPLKAASKPAVPKLAASKPASSKPAQAPAENAPVATAQPAAVAAPPAAPAETNAN
jgi:hypothetical protein